MKHIIVVIAGESTSLFTAKLFEMVEKMPEFDMEHDVIETRTVTLDKPLDHNGLYEQARMMLKAAQQ